MIKNEKKNKIRADQLLVRCGLAPDLIKARAFIMAGQVVADEQRIEKPDQKLDEQTTLRLKISKQNVSRAGKKLTHAIEDFALQKIFCDAVVLDVGASTGGFTQTSLQFGARHVYACDVGQNQLVWELRSDPRVTSIERTDIRNLESNHIGRVDIVLADVSFISLARLIPDLVRLGGSDALYLLLVKPQFELARELVPSGGVVRDHNLRMQAVQTVEQALLKYGICQTQYLDSRVPGRTGNVEVFICAMNDSGRNAQAE